MSSILKGEVQLELCEPGDESRLEVAVKVVRHTRDQETARQRLQRELQAVQRARHRFIVPFFGSAEFCDLLIIISLFMADGNLLQYLRAHPPANRQLLLLQVADAVCYLHTVTGMVHGDLKCENVLISPEGNALLTDFGLSTLIDKPASDSTTTTSIRQLYTLRFAAPEVLQDEAKSSTGRVRSKTTETDVYAFGMLILQALTGRPPWPEIKRRVQNRESAHSRPGAEVTELGLIDEWWALCLCRWNFDPSARPSMDIVRDRIANAITAESSHPGLDCTSCALSASEILERYTAASVAPMRLPAIARLVSRDRNAAGMIVIRIQLRPATPAAHLACLSSGPQETVAGKTNNVERLQSRYWSILGMKDSSKSV